MSEESFGFNVPSITLPTRESLAPCSAMAGEDGTHFGSRKARTERDAKTPFPYIVRTPGCIENASFSRSLNYSPPWRTELPMSRGHFTSDRNQSRSSQIQPCLLPKLPS